MSVAGLSVLSIVVVLGAFSMCRIPSCKAVATNACAGVSGLLERLSRKALATTSCAGVLLHRPSRIALATTSCAVSADFGGQRGSGAEEASVVISCFIESASSMINSVCNSGS